MPHPLSSTEMNPPSIDGDCFLHAKSLKSIIFGQSKSRKLRMRLTEDKLPDRTYKRSQTICLDLIRFNLYLITYIYLILAHVTSAEPEASSFVTCGSLIKLRSELKEQFRLHSHDVKYGSGSGQQSVTAADSKKSSSYW